MTPITKNKTIPLIIALITAGMDFFHLGLVYPIFAEMMDPTSSFSLGMLDWERSFFYSLLIGAFPFGQCIGSPFLGKLSDVYGRKRILFITVAGSALGMTICALGVQYHLPLLMLCGRIFGGLMGANLSLAYAAIVDFSTPHNKTKNLALIPLTTSLGFFLGPLIVGVLENSSAFETSLPLWIATFLSFLNWCLLVFFPDSQAIIKRPKQQSLLMQNRKLWKPLCIAFLMISANFLLVQYVGPYSLNQLHSGLKNVSWLYVNLSLSVAVGHLVLTRNLANVFSPQTALPWTLGLLACTLIAVSHSYSMLSLHITLTLAMLCCAVAYTNVFAYLSNQVSAEQQGEVMGLGVSAQCLAEWIPPLIVGLLALNYPAFPMLAGSIACLFGMSLFYFKNTTKDFINAKKIERNVNY